MKRAAAALLTVTGLVLVLVAVMGAVLVGADGRWRAEARVPPGRSAVVVQPALASVLGPRVALSATADDERTELFVGRARPDDARDLLRDTAFADVHGLSDSRQLAVRSVDGTQAVPAAGDVDVWHAQAMGTGTVRMAWTPTPGAESFVVTRADGGPLPALDLAMTWQDPSWRLLPAAVGGVGLLLLGASYLLGRGPARTRVAA